MNQPSRPTSERPGPGQGETPAGDFPIAIIGAGFAGIGMAIRLKKAGIDSFTIFERASEIGGTWRDNTYPGAACDVPSHLYALSFEPNPDWSRRYASSNEIQAYLLGLVEKWQLRPHLRLDMEVVDARFDEAAGTWALAMDNDMSFTARLVISAVGGLVDPAAPDIAGIEDFGGELFHTARWNHDFDLAGQRVAVIGTGASAVQVVPSLAPEVARLHVFQRTAAWVVPKRDKAYSERSRRLLNRLPFVLWLSRMFKYWLSELLGIFVFLDSKGLSGAAQMASLAHLRGQVKDPELRAKLTPDYQFGCKRVLISDDYWSAFERDNVELVTEPIGAIKRAGIETTDGGFFEVDAIILATGFALSLATPPFPVVGRDGRTLENAWCDGAVAHRGMTVAGFPNWFILMGPNTGPGHTSVLVYTEAQIAHAIEAIERIRDLGLKYVDIRQDVQDRYNERIQGRMEHMSWSSGCNSWYLSDDGSNRTLYPGFAAEYVVLTRTFDPSEYEVTTFQTR